jgi:4-hydroxybenzoate polyprenyltransferase
MSPKASSPSGPARPGAPLARALLTLMRPRQWTKNLVVLAGLLFTGRYANLADAGLALQAVASFLLLSSAVYALNDVLDAPQDREHPEKRLRPVAAGAVAPGMALGFGGLLLALGLLLANDLGLMFLALALAYVAQVVVYSFWAKHQVILDVLFVASGFVLRAAAGAVALKVLISPWLLLCASLLALFLALAKRRQELMSMKARAENHRAALQEYTEGLLDQMIAVVTSSTVLAYALYTFSNHLHQGQPILMLTLPFVLYGIFRYLYLMHRKGMGGRPEEVLLTDRHMLVNVLLWGAVSAALLYLER